jgi:hypothetical protein
LAGLVVRNVVLDFFELVAHVAIRGLIDYWGRGFPELSKRHLQRPSLDATSHSATRTPSLLPAPTLPSVTTITAPLPGSMLCCHCTVRDGRWLLSRSKLRGRRMAALFFVSRSTVRGWRESKVAGSDERMTLTNA